MSISQASVVFRSNCTLFSSPPKQHTHESQRRLRPDAPPRFGSRAEKEVLGAEPSDAESHLPPSDTESSGSAQTDGAPSDSPKRDVGGAPLCCLVSVAVALVATGLLVYWAFYEKARATAPRGAAFFGGNSHTAADYERAMRLASKEQPVTHPRRLRLTLNFYVYSQ